LAKNKEDTPVDNPDKDSASSGGIDRRRLLVAAGGMALTPLTGALATKAHAQSRPSNQPIAHGRRKLGALEVSSIGLGVQNMHRAYPTTIPNRSEMHRIIQSAFDHGVTFFDTAEVYGPHECERILGEAITSFRDQIVITSKFGFDVDFETGQRMGGRNSNPKHIKLAVEHMLKRLQTDRIDLLYQHRVDPNVPIDDVAEAVKQLMDEGKVLHWGLSEMGLKTLRRAHAALPVTAVQSEYSMLWRGPEQDVLSTCEELGIGFVPWSPLGVGFLNAAIDERTRFAEGDFRCTEGRFQPENIAHNMALVKLVQNWAKRKQAQPGQIALAWLLAQKPWIVPIPGTTQMAHLHENIGATTVKFTTEELSELNAAVRAIDIKGARLPEYVQVMSGVDAPLQR